MKDHWPAFWLAFFVGVALLLLALYGCTDIQVGIKRSETPTTRPFFEVATGDTTYDRWLPYVLGVGLFLAPPPWHWCKRRK